MLAYGILFRVYQSTYTYTNASKQCTSTPTIMLSLCIPLGVLSARLPCFSRPPTHLPTTAKNPNARTVLFFFTESKEKDPKLVFNVDQEAGRDEYDRGAEDGMDEEDDDDAEEEEEGDEEWVAEREKDDEDEEEEEDEPPPPMNESSGSDCDPSPTSREAGDKGPAATKKGAGASAGAAGGGGKGSGASNGADKKAFKPTASEKMKTQPGTGEVPESPLWTSFVNSRKGSDGDQLGVVPLKMWESFEKGKCIPRAMKAWYTNKV